jgi:hypothetical protein
MMFAVAALGLVLSPVAAHATQTLTVTGQARADASFSNLTPAWDPSVAAIRA